MSGPTMYMYMGKLLREFLIKQLFYSDLLNIK